jgi:hypothetical protein
MMEFSGGGGLMGVAFPTITQEEKNATVHAALEGGINWFDTAELYGKGAEGCRQERYGGGGGDHGAAAPPVHCLHGIAPFSWMVTALICISPTV